jgi:hypothetical protein
MNAVINPQKNRQRAAWEKELEEIRVEVEREMENLYGYRTLFLTRRR